MLVDKSGTTDEMVERAIEAARTDAYVQKGDLVVVTAGVPVGVPGHTTMLMIRTV
jgi:pyruvate kinase